MYLLSFTESAFWFLQLSDLLCLPCCPQSAKHADCTTSLRNANSPAVAVRVMSLLAYLPENKFEEAEVGRMLCF